MISPIVRSVGLEMKAGSDTVMIVTVQLADEARKPFRRYIELDVRDCQGCASAKPPRQSNMTKRQAEASQKEAGMDLCKKCLVTFRKFKARRDAAAGIPPIDLAGQMIEKYNARIESAENVDQLSQILADLIADAKANEQVRKVVKGLEKKRRAELAGKPSDYEAKA